MAVYERYAQQIPDSLIYEMIDYLKYKQLNFIIAPYEADSQLAYMFHAKKVDYIISEDSDMMVYDCFKVIKGLKNSGKCDVLEYKHRSLPFDGPEEEQELDYFETFIKLGWLIRQGRSQAGLHHDRLRLPGQCEGRGVHNDPGNLQ
jgi:5'-3' exonuclease